MFIVRQSLLKVMLLSLFILSFAGLQQTQAAYPDGVKLIWSNSFAFHDTTNWQKQTLGSLGSYNGAFSDKTVQFSNGIMNLKVSNYGTVNDNYIAQYKTGYTNDLRSGKGNIPYKYGLYVVRMKPSPKDGVVSSFFTFIADTETPQSADRFWHEIDIEFLGNKPNMVQFNNHWDTINTPPASGSHVDSPLQYTTSFDTTADFHEYAFLWHTNMIYFYVDGDLKHSSTHVKPSGHSNAMRIMMNAWADSWAGTFSTTPKVASVQYDWVKFYQLTNFIPPKPYAMIEDAEDLNSTNNMMGWWNAVDDSQDGGNTLISPAPGHSNFKMTNGGCPDSPIGAVKLSYVLGADYQYRYAFLNTDIPENYQDAAQQRYEGLTFWLRGSGHAMSFLLVTPAVTNGNYFSYTISSTPTTNWKRFFIPWESFNQANWGSNSGYVNRDLALTNISAIQFKASSSVSGENGYFLLDDIAFSTNNGAGGDSSATYIDNFDDGDGNNLLGGPWITADDSAAGGNSTCFPAAGTVTIFTDKGYTNSAHAGYFKYTLGSQYQYRYAFLASVFPTVMDLGAREGLHFAIKGSGHKMRVVIDSPVTSDQDHYGYDIQTTPGTWTEYHIPWNFFNQEGWGTNRTREDVLKQVNAIQFKASSMVSNESGYFYIDNFWVGPYTNFMSYGLLVDNFADGDFTDENTGGWFTENDSLSGGITTNFTRISNVAYSNGKSIFYNYTLRSNGFVYFYSVLNDNYPAPVDYSSAKQLRFMIKGSGHKLRVQLKTAAVANANYHGYVIDATPTDWTEVTIPLDKFVQEDWGASTEPHPLDLTAIVGFGYKASSRIRDEVGWFMLDNITFITDIPPAPPPAYIIDQFEDGDWSDNIGGTWVAVDDSGNSGNSTIAVKWTNDAMEGVQALNVKYTLGAAYTYRYVFMKTGYPVATPQDFSGYDHIVFSVKGSGNKMRIVFETTNINDYDYYGYNIAASPSTYTSYTLAWSSFAQEGWGALKPLSLDAIEGIEFKASSQVSGEAGWFTIDNFRLGPEPLDPSLLYAPKANVTEMTCEDVALGAGGKLAVSWVNPSAYITNSFSATLTMGSASNDFAFRRNNANSAWSYYPQPQAGNVDTATGFEFHGFLNFGLGSLPTNSSLITSATLVVTPASFVGTPVYPIRFDCVNYSNDFSPVTSLAKYECTGAGRGTYIADFGSVSSMAAGTPVRVPCTTSIQSMVSTKRSWTKDGTDRWFQVMIKDNDGFNDAKNEVLFYGVEQGVTNEPKLIVHYKTLTPSLFLGTKVIRKTGSYPNSLADGTTVYSNTGNYFTNIGLVNGTTYYYRAFTYSPSNYFNTNFSGAFGTPTGLVDSPLLSVTKTLSNVTLAGLAVSNKVPGATLTYIIFASNYGTGVATNLRLTDAINTNLMFQTNQILSGTGWTVEYSTNAAASYAAVTGYSTLVPSNKSKIKWIRWRKTPLAVAEKVRIRLKVIVK